MTRSADRQMLIRVRPEVKRAAMVAAAHDGLTANAWVNHVVERALGRRLDGCAHDPACGDAATHQVVSITDEVAP